MDAQLKDKYEKIANLMALEVPQKQIAIAVGLSDGRISQIKDDPEFQELFAAKVVENAERHGILNDGWDAVEAQALSIVNANLGWNKNPDFALRAAMVANKAQRRGQLNTGPSIAAQAGARVILNLNPQFINKLQQINNAASDAAGCSEPEAQAPVNDATQQRLLPAPTSGRKMHDVMSIEGVKSLFKREPSLKDDIMGAVEGLELSHA